MALTISNVFLERTFEAVTPWRWWTSLLAAAAIFAASTFVIFVVTVVAIIGTANPEQLDSGDLPELGSTAIMAITLFSQFLELGLLIFVIRRGMGWSRLLHLRPVGLDLRQLLATAATILMAVVAGVAWARLYPEADAADGEWINQLLADPASRFWTLVILIVGAPLSEELLVRGFLLPPLSRTRLGFSGAAIVTSLLWAVIHLYTWQGTVIVFVFGLLLSYLLWRTGSLWPSIAAHAVLNSFFAASYFLA